MSLSAKEMSEWRRVSKKARAHGIQVRRIPYNSNVSFGGDVYAQLGLGNAERIVDARIRLKKKKSDFGL